MEGNYIVYSNDNSNNNASLVSMTPANQMMPSAAFYAIDPNTSLHIDTTPVYQNNGASMYYEQAAPVVKSHQPISIYPPPIVNCPQQQQQQETTNMNHFYPMEIDDSFLPVLDNMFIHSPLSTSITTNNSSIMLMDTMSPVSPMNQQFIAPTFPMYSEPVMPTYVDTPQRQPLPRRHTVSLPYPHSQIIDCTTSPPPPLPPTKSRKSSLKAKRHRSMGKIDIHSPDVELSAKLEHWTHEQLLERVRELENEKKMAQQKQKEPVSLSRKTSHKIRSASQTDTEVEDEEEEEEGPHFCKWDICTLEYNTLSELINHIKLDHIGSGKGSYYCCWKDCARKQKPFTKKHKMHNHLRTHTGERPFACEEPECGKKFSRLDSLATHAKIHSNIRPYLCNVGDCGKAYYHLRSLRKHERSHKEGVISPPPLPTMLADNSLETDWGLSAQAAVFDVMDRNSFTM